MFPLNGHLIIGFKMHNHGVWLMYCHIARHSSAGLARQVVKRVAEIPDFMCSGVDRDYLKGDVYRMDELL
jgi:hypothetical protein